MPTLTPLFRDAYYPDGTMKGSYVYMLLCQDLNGPIYVKIGISDRPTDRMHALRRTCAVTPHIFATIEVRTRQKARRIEDHLKEAYNNYNTVGEWFLFQESDKTEFNRIWKLVLLIFSDPDQNLKWETVAIKPFEQIAFRNKMNNRIMFKRRGAAFRDFCNSH